MWRLMGHPCLQQSISLCLLKYSCPPCLVSFPPKWYEMTSFFFIFFCYTLVQLSQISGECLGSLFKLGSGAPLQSLLWVPQWSLGVQVAGKPAGFPRQPWMTLNRQVRLQALLLQHKQLYMCLLYLFSLLPKICLNTDFQHLNKNW